MLNNFDQIFKEYTGRYQKILSKYYPAHSRTGFTERNLSVNFANAVEKIYPNAFTWFEAPFGDKKRKHFDAVIFNSETKEVFIVESKRFDDLNEKTLKKLKHVIDDIERISCNKHLHHVVETFKEINQINDLVFYGVILADVWLENDEKKRVYESWGKNILKEYQVFNVLDEDVRNALEIGWWGKNGNEVVSFENWHQNYRLLVTVFEVPIKE